MKYALILKSASGFVSNNWNAVNKSTAPLHASFVVLDIK